MSKLEFTIQIELNLIQGFGTAKPFIIRRYQQEFALAAVAFISKESHHIYSLFLNLKK
jgi:hypothetical protein